MQPKFQYKSRKCYIFWVCVSILRYSAWNTHAPYCHLWSFRLYRIFPHYIINGNISGKKKTVTEYNTCFDNFLQLLSETFTIRRRTERVVIKSVQWSSCILVRFQWNLVLSTDFSKTTQMPHFKKIRPVRAFHEERRADGRTDWHDAANSRHSQFCERA